MNPAKKATRPKPVARKSGTRPSPVKPGVLSRKSKEDKNAAMKSPPPKSPPKAKTEQKTETPLTFGKVNLQNAKNREEETIISEKPSPTKTAFEFKPVVKSQKVNEDTHAERSNSFENLDKLTANMRSQGTSLDSVIAPSDKKLVVEKLSKDSQLCFVFIKPHCCGIKGIDKMVIEMLKEAGVEVIEKGMVPGKTIASQGLVDIHYTTMSKRAMVLKPCKLVVPSSGQAEFQNIFGISWARAVEEE